MTTKEFREKLAKYYKKSVVANDTNNVAYVSELSERYLETYKISLPLEVFDLICEYARTPIDEREEQPKYYWQLQTGNSYDGRDDNLFFGYIYSPEGWYFTSKENNAVLRNAFTEDEFNELKERLDIIPDFKPIEIE